MYAIIRAGGHQEKVTPGEQITVDRVKQQTGEEITFTPLMIAKGDGTVVSDKKELADQAKVVGRVVEHLKGDKIDVFQYRQKTGYRRHTGHRQPLTLVEITEIHLGSQVERAPEKPAEPEPAPAKTAEDKAKRAEAKKKASKEKSKARAVTSKKKATTAKASSTSGAKKA